MDEFTKQTQGCGELLYNLDYTTKYLTKFENEYTLTSKYGTFDAPWLFGDERVNNDEISFY